VRSTLRRLRWWLLLGAVAACEVNPQPPIPASADSGGNSAGMTSAPGAGATSSGGTGGTGIDFDPGLPEGGEAAMEPEPPDRSGEGGEPSAGVGGAAGNDSVFSTGGAH
jgi:hypothetical protein